MATEDITAQVLDALSESDDPLLSSDVFPSLPSTAVKSALDRLGSRSMVVYKTIDREEYILSEEGNDIVTNGSHEAKVFEAVRKAVDGLKITDLPVCPRPSSGLCQIAYSTRGHCRERECKGWPRESLCVEMDPERQQGQHLT